METRVKITEEDNLEVWRLFHKYNALLDVLSYMNANSPYTEFLDKKVEEATEICMQLETAKSKCKIKYYPEGGNYTNYVFDFENQEMVFGE